MPHPYRAIFKAHLLDFVAQSYKLEVIFVVIFNIKLNDHEIF